MILTSKTLDSPYLSTLYLFAQSNWQSSECTVPELYSQCSHSSCYKRKLLPLQTKAAYYLANFHVYLTTLINYHVKLFIEV